MKQESPFMEFIRLHPDYPNRSESNIQLFEYIRTECGNDFTNPESFAKAWAAHREEIIQAVSSHNAERFLAECPAYPGGNFNAEIMSAHIRTQVGDGRVWTVENYFSAYEYLKSEGLLATEIEYTEPEKKPTPIHPARALADAMATRAAEEAKLLKLRKMSPIGKPVSKALISLATKSRRDNVEPNLLSRQDRFPERVEI
jgi:hypothetical protein